MSTRTLIAAIILVCFNVLGVYTQPRRIRNEPQPSYIYRVSMTEKESGKKRFGFIDKSGKLVIGFDRLPKNTIAVGDFLEGRARIYLTGDGEDKSRSHNNSVGFIDETGRVIIKPRFDTARDFSEGLAYVEAKNFKGFIDRFGRLAIKTSYRLTKDFHEGLAAVGMNDTQPHKDWGYIDRSGKLVIKQQYAFADDFSEGLAGVAVGPELGFINKQGKMVIQPRFGLRVEGRHKNRIISSGRFVSGLACVRVGEMYGYSNRKGVFVISPQFDKAQEFSEGLAWATKTQSRGEIQVGWIDKSARWVITEVEGFRFSESPQLVVYANEYRDWRFSEGLMSFYVYSPTKTLHGYMDRQGKIIVKPREIEKAEPFLGDLALVVFNDNSTYEEKYGYINKKGAVIWKSY